MHTQAMPDIVLARPDATCYFCSNLTTMPHHIIRRSQGGTEGPQIMVCQRCHDQFTLNKWDIILTDQMLMVVAKDNNATVYRRLLGGTASDVFGDFHDMGSKFDQFLEQVPYLDEDEMIYLFPILNHLGRKAFAACCALVYEALEYRMVWGSRTQKMDALAKTYGVSRATIINMAKSYGAFGVELADTIERIGPSKTYLAADTETPQEWAAEAFEKHLTVPQLKAAIREQEPFPWSCPWLGDGGQCEHPEHQP